jgi:hypothetical protein
MFDPDSDGDMLQAFEVVFLQGILSDCDLARNASRDDWFSAAHFKVSIHDASGKLDSGEVYPSLWLHKFPLLGLHDVCVSIEGAVTILVAEGSISSGIVPIWVVRVYGPAGPNGNVLNISPR